MPYRTNSLSIAAVELPSSEKRLSICLKPNGFSFSITSTKEVLLAIGDAQYEGANTLSDLSNSIKGYFEGLGVFSLGFDSVQLVVPSDYSTWVPTGLYNNVMNRQYISLVGGTVRSEQGVFACHNGLFDAEMVFVADSMLVTAFKIALPGLTVTSQHGALCCPTVKTLSDNCAVMVLHLREGMADVEVMDQGQLLLSSTYRVANDNDLQYTAIDVMKRMNIETPTMQLLLCGDVSRETYALLRNYFPTVKLYTGRKLGFGMPEMQQLHTYRHALILS